MAAAGERPVNRTISATTSRSGRGWGMAGAILTRVGGEVGAETERQPVSCHGAPVQPRGEDGKGGRARFNASVGGGVGRERRGSGASARGAAVGDFARAGGL